MNKIKVRDHDTFGKLFELDDNPLAESIKNDSEKLKKLKQFLSQLIAQEIDLSEYIDILYTFNKAKANIVIEDIYYIKDLVWTSGLKSTVEGIVDFNQEQKLTGKKGMIISDAFGCARCKNRKELEVVETQDRSGDEGTSVYALCPKCNHKTTLS